MTAPSGPTSPNSDNSPAGLGNTPILNLNGVGNGTQINPAVDLVNNLGTVNLDPFNQPPVMKTLVYSPDIQVKIATANGKEYDISSDVVRGQLYREENAASTFFCELANKDQRYTKDGGIFSRMDRITVFMRRTNWVQVFSGYLDTVPFAQLWAGNVSIKATCTLKRLMYTYWNPNLTYSKNVFNQLTVTQNNTAVPQAAGPDNGIGDLLGNVICWVGGWDPQNVHIQDFPVGFFNAMKGEFERIGLMGSTTEDAFLTLLLGSDHTTGVGPAAGTKILSTGPGLGPQVVGAASYKEQVIRAVDDRGMGPKTKDIQNAYLAQQSSATGQGARDDASRTAFEQNTSLSTAQQQQARDADAAILAFACVWGESNWMMWANRKVPESLNYHYDLIGNDHDSIGLFQQRNQGWGSVIQRMNAYASAGMFLDALAKIPGWENMPPAEAIARVQRNRDGASTYAKWIEVARQEVQAIRAGQGLYTPQNIAGVGVSSVASSTAGQAIVNTATGIAGVPAISQNSPSPSSVPITQSGKPNPDSQGAVNCALAIATGKPYKIGGRGPAFFDAPGLIYYVYKSIGREVGETTDQQAVSYQERVQSLTDLKPGDAIQLYGGKHTVLYIGNGMIMEAVNGSVVTPKPMYFSPGDVAGIYRYADWGGPGPAPFNPVAGPGTAVGTGYVSASGTGSDGQTEQVARNLFSYIFQPAKFAPSIANLFSGEKSFIDCQPLIQEVQAISRSGLRNFASAPNGDFIAYYPDHFGVDGKPIAMIIEGIEMKDVRINLSDDSLTTHVYVSGDTLALGLQAKNQALGWLASRGIATVENETLFQRLKRVVPGGAEDLTGQQVLQKYGVRPIQLEFNMIADAQLEFLTACHIFMEKWAAQYETTARFTFMPELFPGMRVQLAETGIVVYVSSVVHTFDWEQGFSTEATIMAPSAVGGGQAVSGVAPVNPANTTARPTSAMP